MGVRTRDFANSGANGINWNKSNYNHNINTMRFFSSILVSMKQVMDLTIYRLVGRVGGSQASGNTSIQVRWVNSGGSTVNSGYYSGNFTQT